MLVHASFSLDEAEDTIIRSEYIKVGWFTHFEMVVQMKNGNLEGKTGKVKN